MGMLVDDIGDYIISQGLAKDGEVFSNFRPDDPDFVVVISEYDSRTSIGVTHAGSRRFQIIIRAKRQTESAGKAWAIYKSIFKDNQSFIHINEDRFIVPVPLQQPLPLETDDRGRSVYVFNVLVTTNNDF